MRTTFIAGCAAAGVAVVFWGASFVATRFALDALTPIGLVFVRVWLAAIFLLAVCRRRQRRHANTSLFPRLADQPACVALGILLAVHITIQAVGLKHTTAVNTGWIIGLIPVMIAVVSHFLGKQRLRTKGWFGIGLSLSGVMLVISASLPDFADARFGDMLQLISCATWTLYTVLGVGAVQRNGALRVTSYVLIVAGIAASPMLLYMDMTHSTPDLRTVLAVLFLAIPCSGTALFLWSYATKVIGTTRTGAFLYFEPLVTLAVAVPLLHEPVTRLTLAGAACIFGGVWLVAYGVSKDRKR